VARRLIDYVLELQLLERKLQEILTDLENALLLKEEYKLIEDAYFKIQKARKNFEKLKGISRR